MSNRDSQTSQGALCDDGSEDASSVRSRAEGDDSRLGPSRSQSYEPSMYLMNTLTSSPTSNDARPRLGSIQPDQDALRRSGSSAVPQDRPEFHNAFAEGPRRNLSNDYPHSASSPWTNGPYHGEKLPSLGEMLSNGSPFSPPQATSTSRSPSWLEPFGQGRTSPREYPQGSNDPSKSNPFAGGPLHVGPARQGVLADAKGENAWERIPRPSSVVGAAPYSAQHEQNFQPQPEAHAYTSRPFQSPFSHGYEGDNRPRSSGHFQSRSSTINYADPADALVPSDESVGDTASDTTLPKFVRRENIPGEGLFFLYDDGSRCPAVIDGEAVNEHWGITKAGKPRRRLALACVTCRDKKIKCDPGEPKCAQCSKCGRECWTRPPARKHHSSSSASSDHHVRPLSGYSADIQEPFTTDRGHFSATSPTSSTGPLPTSYPSSKRASEAPSEQRGRRQNPPLTRYEQENTRKRRKSSISAASPRTKTLSPHSRYSSTSSYRHQMEDFDKNHPISYHSKHNFGDGIHSELDQLWKEDPFIKDANFTTEVFRLYFKHVNPSTYNMFSRDHFMRWIEHDRQKSPQDLMVVYSMMTMALQFYTGDVNTGGIQAVSCYAIGRQTGQFTLQLVQSRLLLALSEFGSGRTESAWEYCGSALRAASAINLNLEISHLDIELPDRPFGLSANMYAECRRRTYWAAYIMDVSLFTGLSKEGSLLTDVSSQRFNGHVAGHVSTLNDADAILRLPMDQHAYANSAANSCSTFLDLALMTTKTSPTKLEGLGPMAHLVLISAIWNDVLANLYRSMFRAGDSYSDWYEELIRESTKRLKVWADNLPQQLRYIPGNRRNLDFNLSKGQGAVYVAMHSLYYTTRMKLNRHGRLQHMRHTLIAAIVRDAVHGAQEYLEFIQLLASREKSKGREIDDFLPPPFTGFAITTACDIISAKGRLRGIPQTIEMMSGGLCTLEELSPVWAAADAQKNTLHRRIKDLTQRLPLSTPDPDAMVHSDDPFSLPTPMEQTFRLDGDLIYSATVEAYLGAMEGILSVNVSTHHRGYSSNR